MDRLISLLCGSSQNEIDNCIANYTGLKKKKKKVLVNWTRPYDVYVS